MGTLWILGRDFRLEDLVLCLADSFMNLLTFCLLFAVHDGKCRKTSFAFARKNATNPAFDIVCVCVGPCSDSESKRSPNGA